MPSPEEAKREARREAALKAKSALKGGAKKIDLSWVDFYRR